MEIVPLIIIGLLATALGIALGRYVWPAVRGAERIRSLGVKTKRPMPSMLVEGVSIVAPTDDSEENISSETDREL